MIKNRTGTAIQVRGLSKQFGSFRALDNVSFDVLGGRVTGFLGHNGSGKTTTMRVLLGLSRANEGSYTYVGRYGTEVRKPVVAWSSETCGLQGGRTASAHMRSVAATFGLDTSVADEALADAGLAAMAKKRIGGFSTGMRRRLALAEVSITPTEWVLLDEPLNGLDPEGVQWMRHKLREMARQGHAVLVSSHLLNEAERYVDDIVMLGRGSVMFAGRLDEWRQAFGARREVVVENAHAAEELLAGIPVLIADIDRLAVPEDEADQAVDVLNRAGIAASVEGPATLSLEAMYNSSMKGLNGESKSVAW